jgi:hypothetical protein
MEAQVTFDLANFSNTFCPPKAIVGVGGYGVGAYGTTLQAASGGKTPYVLQLPVTCSRFGRNCWSLSSWWLRSWGLCAARSICWVKLSKHPLSCTGFNVCSGYNSYTVGLDVAGGLGAPPGPPGLGAPPGPPGLGGGHGHGKHGGQAAAFVVAAPYIQQPYIQQQYIQQPYIQQYVAPRPLIQQYVAPQVSNARLSPHSSQPLSP